MEGQIEGGCLCGKVRFRVPNEFERLYFCHCAQCRKITGSAHASILYTAPENLHWLTGEQLIQRYEYPGRDFTKAFCRECGSGLPYLNQQGSAVLIPSGCLDGEPRFASQAHIFWGEKPYWSTSISGAKYFLKFPD